MLRSSVPHDGGAWGVPGARGGRWLCLEAVWGVAAAAAVMVLEVAASAPVVVAASGISLDPDTRNYVK
jgi:hypothetical protein